MTLYNCQLLRFSRLALSIVVEVFPRPFCQTLLLQGCSLQTRYAKLYALSMSGVYFLKFLKVIFLLSPFEKLHHSLFYLSILFLTFFSPAPCFQCIYDSLFIFSKGPCFWPIKSNTPNSTFYKFLFYFQTKVIQTEWLLFITKHNFR